MDKAIISTAVVKILFASGRNHIFFNWNTLRLWIKLKDRKVYFLHKIFSFSCKNSKKRRAAKLVSEFPMPESSGLESCM